MTAIAIRQTTVRPDFRYIDVIASAYKNKRVQITL